jgi:hypothetical protein
MPISDDWDFNFATRVISHIDGVLTYDNGSGTQPSVGQYIYGNTSGALGKVLARTGTATAGTLTLTNVLGQFANNETLDVLSSVAFDNIANGGFTVGDTVVDQVTGSIDVLFVEYNIDGTPGHGTAYGNNMTAFTNNSQLDISGGTANVGLADGTGTDNDTLWDAQPDGTLARPGAATENDCVIIHYTSGTIAIPEDARIQSVTSTAEGYAQRVYGSTAVGSIRVIDSDTSGGAWTNAETLRILDCEYYDTLVGGKVFSEGDIVRGATSLFEARVLAVIDDGDNTGKLIFAGNTGGAWTDGEAIQVRQPDDTYVTYANVESAQNSYLNAATLNIPASGARSIQRADQGGIFPTGSLNLVRSANAFYSYAQDLLDELGQLDDPVALEGNVRDQLYTVLNAYIIPDLSFRFLEKGSFKDFGNNNIFVNIQTTGAIADIGNHGYFYDSTNPTPQPDMYVEQNNVVARQDWLEGHLDMLLKVKTSTNPKFINPAVNALGQFINGGAFTVHVRPYTRTYDSNEVTIRGGIAVVALGNAVDLNNTSAQYQFAYNTGTGTPFTAGEEATVAASGKRIQIVSSDTGATGNFTYVLKSGTNLVATDVVLGSVSGAQVTCTGTVTNLVAGYGTNIRVMTVQRRFTGGTTTVAAYVLGELITQTGSGATGYFMEDDGGTIYIEEESGTFNGTGLLTGAISGALNTPTATAAWGDWGASEGVPKDIGGGVGDKDYLVVVSANITDASARPVQEVYEWWKFITRKESQYEINNAGGLFSAFTQGRIYRRAFIDFAEVRGASPLGTKAGSLVIGAQGVFIEKFTLATADIRSIQLIDNLGDTYNPPNLQVLDIINLVSGNRAAAYRSDGVGSEVILRNEFDVGTVGGGNNQAGDSTILVGAGNGGGGRSVSPLPNDVPDSGVLRILDPNGTGNYLRFVYDLVNRTTNVFTLQQGIGQDTIGDVTGAVDLVADDNVHVVFIERQSAGSSVNNTIQYVSDINLFVVVRIKGKQPFKTAATFGNTGASIGAVLNPDNVVNLP